MHISTAGQAAQLDPAVFSAIRFCCTTIIRNILYFGPHPGDQMLFFYRAAWSPRCRFTDEAGNWHSASTTSKESGRNAVTGLNSFSHAAVSRPCTVLSALL
jgi:hypothetical protein